MGIPLVSMKDLRAPKMASRQRHKVIFASSCVFILIILQVNGQASDVQGISIGPFPGCEKVADKLSQKR